MFNVGDIVTTEGGVYIWRVIATSPENGVELLTIGEDGSIWPEERHFSIGWSGTEGLIPFSPEPEVDEELVITKYVYVAYMKHQFRGTELALSGIMEEQLEHIIRGHPNYTVLAKKRIKFTI